MSTTVLAPKVAEFLAVVRAQLADLDPEEQREITDGLVADLTDLVAERGSEALGDPVAYARELRQAAGLEESGPRSTEARRERRPLGELTHAVLDEAATRWQRTIAAAPGDLGDLLTTLRPVWWVLRAWIAIEIVAMWIGGVWALTVVPGGGMGWLAMAVAIVLSVQLGRGKLWPGERWRTTAGLRVLLLGLNVLALVLIPVVGNGLGHGWGWQWESGWNEGLRAGADPQSGYDDPKDKAGLYSGGKWVTNVFAYDAAGQPITGVQLFDQDGKPLDIVAQPQCVSETGEVEVIAKGEESYADCSDLFYGDDGEPLAAAFRVFYPWTNGATQLSNVFPIPSRSQDTAERSATAFTEDDKPAVGTLPLVNVAPVSLPGILASVVKVPKAATPAE